MFFNSNSNRRRGFTLLEFLFGIGIGGLAIAAVVGFSIFGSKSLAALYASCSLDQQNRKTFDQMTKDIRNVLSVTNFSTNTFACIDWDSTALTYLYNPANQTLSRIKAGKTNVLLSDCTRFTFSYGMRLLSNGTFSVYPATNTYEIKAITAKWCCVKKVLGRSKDDMPQYITVNIRTKQ
jgi:prepilin-type N-terminal cleavage/methylation domain-containing protein